MHGAPQSFHPYGQEGHKHTQCKGATLGSWLLIKVKPQRKCWQQKLTIMNLTRNYIANQAKLDFYCLERNYANVWRRQRQLTLAAEKKN